MADKKLERILGLRLRHGSNGDFWSDVDYNPESDSKLRIWDNSEDNDGDLRLNIHVVNRLSDGTYEKTSKDNKIGFIQVETDYKTKAKLSPFENKNGGTSQRLWGVINDQEVGGFLNIKTAEDGTVLKSVSAYDKVEFDKAYPLFKPKQQKETVKETVEEDDELPFEPSL